MWLDGSGDEGARWELDDNACVEERSSWVVVVLVGGELEELGKGAHGGQGVGSRARGSTASTPGSDDGGGKGAMVTATDAIGS
ncbi:hypothetical protein E2562_004024 [Oryza meyeriana var. granulata]|uniref:DUF834 domain-containing protein n=1 Tax=Oryza meyeriana var. granulata TaxID=110450 RepID=A0A6G1BJ39_9ORYZ|nr:hypothetical protein E2562_004024 [Oryza meyeriana var. granulata]